MSVQLTARRDALSAAHMQYINLSYSLRPIAYQLLLTTIAALVVIICSGHRPALWQPRFTVFSIILCAIAQAIAWGMFMFVMS